MNGSWNAKERKIGVNASHERFMEREGTKNRWERVA
jgi:hypothetical protein